jgi:hypothetical protein
MNPTKANLKNLSASSGPSIPQSAFRIPQSPPALPLQTAPSSILHLPSSQRIDALQAAIERMQQAELPLTHRFTPGMYIRTIFMPAGALVISKIHRTQHPFVVTKGRCLVWDPMAGGAATIRAGHIGITMPGTRRVIYIFEDTEWTTFHATDKTTPEAVEADIIEPHDFDREEALKGILDFRFAICDLNHELRATADGRSIANLKSKIEN